MKDYSVFDNMLEGVHVLSPEWRYIYANDALIKQSKFSKEKVYSSTMLELYEGIEHTEVYKNFSKCMRERVSVKMVNRFEFPDGSVGWFRLNMDPVKEGILVRTVDISEVKRLEEELQKKNEILEFKVTERNKELLETLAREKELSKMKSDFVSMASHEFKTPLSGILSSVSLMEEYFKIEQYKKCPIHFSRVKSSIFTMTGTLNNFLSFNDEKKGDLTLFEEETFHIEDFFMEIVEYMTGILKQQQTIHYSHQGDVNVVLSKKTLRNVLYNLVSNSINYSEKDIVIESVTTETELRIVVKDEGIGIPKKQQKQLFDKFFRASNTNSIEGTGLGMNIVKHYVESMKGDICFESEENKGTTFFLSFPLKRK